MSASLPGSREQTGWGSARLTCGPHGVNATSGHSLWVLKLEQQYLPSLAPKAAENRYPIADRSCSLNRRNLRLQVL